MGGGYTHVGATDAIRLRTSFGVPVVRTAVWTIGLIGLGMAIWPLLFG